MINEFEGYEDNFEDWEARAEKEIKAVLLSFPFWRQFGKITEKQKEWLSKRTPYFPGDSLTEFYQSYGLLEDDGETLTEYGQKVIDEQEQEAGADSGQPAQAVGTQTEEPPAITAEEWEENGYYMAIISAGLGNEEDAEELRAVGYDEYTQFRSMLKEDGFVITGEKFQATADRFPGLLTYDNTVNIFQTVDDRIIEFKTFPEFSKTAKIKIHDSVVLAADTGAGKSSLAMNFLNDLNDRFPVLYFNLEMSEIDILRRLVSIRSGLSLDTVEEYKKDEKAAAAVNEALRTITSRKSLQVLENAYYIEDIEEIIKRATEYREDPTAVFIDHSLLVQTKTKVAGRYDRFTIISEELRRISRQYNIVLFVLLQQSRAGKADEEERPRNSSLKESGSWENDATQICFLWWDPVAKRKKLLITKNRNGAQGDFILRYDKKTQIYAEAKDQALNINSLVLDPTRKPGKREKAAERLQAAINAVSAKNGGNPTAKDLAVEMDVTTATVKRYIKEYGPDLGLTVNGRPCDPVGTDEIQQSDFIRLAPKEAEEAAATFEEGGDPEQFG